jgi:cytochrome c553
MLKELSSAKFQSGRRASALVLGILCLFGTWNLGFGASPDDSFEKRIRPMLIEHCYKCHSVGSEKLKAGLYLDSREGLLKGGDTGPGLVPGAPEKSLLIKAVSYGDTDLQMPPKGKLSDAQIADLKQWIKDGAHWPNTQTTKVATKAKTFDLETRRRDHWAWQALTVAQPPKVHNSQFTIQSPIDQFIFAKIESNGLTPSQPTDRRTLIRRASFDLTGLPPTAPEIDAFLNDKSTDAFTKVVDRLLASPHFGERWARHWFDRMRYAETMGHEFDYHILNAWRYRDYAIRALNSDVPYDQFAAEHIAGDLLSNPRINPDNGVNESAVATAFYWFCQQVHAPVDIKQAQAEVIENQIDVLSKTFQGMTIACARCHDHKFDAISTKDFYSLYGVLSSSRYTQRVVNESVIIDQARKLAAAKSALRGEVAAAWKVSVNQLEKYLIAASEITDTNAIPAVAKERGLSAEKLQRWHSALPEVLKFQWAAEKALEGNVDISNFNSWFRHGPAFTDFSGGDFLAGKSAEAPVVGLISPAALHSARLSTRLEGEARSPTFTITNNFLHILGTGHDIRLRVVIDNFTLVRSPIYGGLKVVPNTDAAQWFKFDLSMWQGHRAYVELVDNTASDPAEDKGGKPDSKHSDVAYGSILRVILSNNPAPPTSQKSGPGSPTEHSQPSNTDTARRFAADVKKAISAWSSAQAGESQYALLNGLLQRQLLGMSMNPMLAARFKEFKLAEEKLPDAILVAGMADGTPLDEHVFIRGSHRALGERVERRFLEGINPLPFREGSGRLELARHIVDPANPLTARVFVNYVWHHLFGRGIVPTVDNFGVLGEPPSHPELLDWLAATFQQQGWSTKKLIRQIMLTRTYQMASQPANKQSNEKDPANVWLSRANVRRLEGEAIRDALLAVSGRLDTTMHGEPVPIHLTPFMEGRGKPGKSGPLDGDGRRTVYVEVRRNFLPPMMLAFDTPIPASTVGRRSISNVPAQALILMNDPFVIQQAQVWARRVLDANMKDDTERIQRMYLDAFGRPPMETELKNGLAFIQEQTQSRPNETQQVWADLCHVLFNVKDFIFIN